MIVVDMQDVGVRLYTFIWTMYKVMQATSLYNSDAAPYPVRFLVCDRPNPLSGLLVDGPVLNTSCCQSESYGLSPIPHIHGMTIGELAGLMNNYEGGESLPGFISPPLKTLEVLRMQEYDRTMTVQEMNLRWIPPSPNIPTAGTVQVSISFILNIRHVFTLLLNVSAIRPMHLLCFLKRLLLLKDEALPHRSSSLEPHFCILRCT